MYRNSRHVTSCMKKKSEIEHHDKKKERKTINRRKKNMNEKIIDFLDIVLKNVTKSLVHNRGTLLLCGGHRKDGSKPSSRISRILW